MTQHNFVDRKPSVDYVSKKHLSSADACAFKECEECEVQFDHYYKKETWKEALKRAGISKKCN